MAISSVYDGYKMAGIELTDARLLKIMRFIRNEKLKQSDWTQLTDSPLSTNKKIAWANYRQALRDLPENTADVKSPIFPSEPE
jgi:hypothetical protein